MNKLRMFSPCGVIVRRTAALEASLVSVVIERRCCVPFCEAIAIPVPARVLPRRILCFVPRATNALLYSDTRPFPFQYSIRLIASFPVWCPCVLHLLKSIRPPLERRTREFQRDFPPDQWISKGFFPRSMNFKGISSLAEKTCEKKKISAWIQSFPRVTPFPRGHILLSTYQGRKTSGVSLRSLRSENWGSDVVMWGCCSSINFPVSNLKGFLSRLKISPERWFGWQNSGRPNRGDWRDRVSRSSRLLVAGTRRHHRHVRCWQLASTWPWRLQSTSPLISRKSWINI